MEIVRIEKQQLFAGIDTLIERRIGEVIGPADAMGGRFSFAVLDSAASLRLDYDETTFSPRKFLFPARDPLLTYATGDPDSYKPVFDDRPRCIVGIHPGDLAAIALYDAVCVTDGIDEQYRARRQATLLIGIYPTRPWRFRFTDSMIGPDDCYRAADLMMVAMGNDTFAVEIVTSAGKKFIAGMATAQLDEAAISAVNERKHAARDVLTLPAGRDSLPALPPARAACHL